MSKLLRENSVFWSKLGFCYDPPRLGKDGKPIVFFDNWETVRKYHVDFYRAGIRLHTCILFNGWVGDGKYDYELTDRVLDTVFSCGGEDLLFIPRIKLNVPIEWEKNHPEELCVYADGPRDAEQIRTLVGTAKHDFLGYQSPRGYYTAGGWQDDRPNVGGVISNQSFSSKQWLADAGETLRRIIRHIEDGPYGKRIPAYHIAYGVSGESCVWGRCNVFNSADYGIANRRAFYDWGIRKYGSVEKLGKVWCQPDITAESVILPSPEQKDGPVRSMNSFFRRAPEDAICLDYDLFTADSNVNALEHFGKIVKEETHGKEVGAFYGYILGVARSTYTGYDAVRKVIESPYIDFLAAPKAEGGGEMAPVQSVNRKKLWMDELDNRTCIAKGTGFEYKSSDMAETKNTMWREFAKNLTHGSSFWWMDLGGGWYDSPELMKEIARIETTAKQLRGRSGKSTAKICVIVDDDAFHRHKTGFYLHHCLFHQLIGELNRCGEPWDLYLADEEDLYHSNQYRLYIFANPFGIIRRPDHGVSIWYYAGEAFSKLPKKERFADFKEHCSVSGILAGTPPLEWPEHKPNDEVPVAEDVPVYAFEGPGLASYADGTSAVVQHENDIFCGAPILKAAHFRAIMRFSGIEPTAPENVLVYSDERLIAFWAWEHVSFETILPNGLEAVANIPVSRGKQQVTLDAKNIAVYLRYKE